MTWKPSRQQAVRSDQNGWGCDSARSDRSTHIMEHERGLGGLPGAREPPEAVGCTLVPSMTVAREYQQPHQTLQSTTWPAMVAGGCLRYKS